MTMQRFRLGAEIWLWRHGWLWPLVGILAMAALGVHLLWTQPAKRAAAELRREAAAAALSRVRTGTDSGPRTEPLRQVFGNKVEPAQVLLHHARAAGISLPQAEYRRQSHGAIGAVQWQVTQSVRASYPQVRRYIGSVLRDVPNASLDQVLVRRDNVGAAEVEVKLRWSFWMIDP